jgi:hypothetical protein
VDLVTAPPPVKSNAKEFTNHVENENPCPQQQKFIYHHQRSYRSMCLTPHQRNIPYGFATKKSLNPEPYINPCVSFHIRGI